MNRDAEHLQLLSIFYYVQAGLTALFSSFSLIYVFMGVVFTVLSVNGATNAPRPVVVPGNSGGEWDSSQEEQQSGEPAADTLNEETWVDDDALQDDTVQDDTVQDDTVQDDTVDSNDEDWASAAPMGPAPPPPMPTAFFAMFGVMFIVIGLLALFLGLIFAASCFLVGRCLARRKYRIFCLVVAGLICTSFPLGTILGVFTFIVLLRPSVAALFEQQNIQNAELVAE